MRKEVIRQNDFSISERPSTRKAQFFDVLKHQKMNMVKISLLQTVFNAPLMVWAYLYYLFLAAGPSSVFKITVYAGLILIPCVVMANIGLCGSFACLKKIAYADGMFASSSFFLGMKEEWKKCVLFGLIQGLASALLLIGFVLVISVKDVNVYIKGLALAMVIILFLVSTMMNYYSLAQVSVYSNKTGVIIKNSFLLSLMRFPKHLLLFLLHPCLVVGLVCGAFCIPIAGQYVGIAVLLLFSFFNSFSLFAWMLFILTSFDKFINKDHYPDYVNKGLYIKK